MDSESQASSKTQPELEGSTLNRQILSLAVPALGALIAEPLFATIDSAMVGHLGTLQLAGLGLASTILVTFFGVFIFLAYSTTAITSRALGAKCVADGLKAGIDAIWLALFLCIISTGVLVFKAEIIVTWFHPEPGVIPYAIEYLQFASPGLAGMMVVLAATGTLRGLLDTKTPLYVALGGAMVNTILNAILIYGLNLGVAGSGLGTAISQTLMGVVLVAIVVRAARSHDVDMKPSFGGLGSSIVVGLPLLILTMSLRLAILATVAAVTRIGAIALSSHQAVVTLWNFAAYALDALGISAQALV